jgi:large subunit ribosomal protein L25
MSEVVLNAEVREATGKHAKYLRNKGSIPGVFYAHDEKNINIQVAKVNLEPLVFTSEAHVIELRLGDGTSKKCILRDVQFDPVTDKPIHFDLQGLKENEKLTIDIPVVLIGGIPAGVREGGMLQHIVHRIRVSCLPKDIPEKIEVNVAELAMNRSIHVGELNIPNVAVLDNPENPVVSVVPPTIIKEPEPAAAVEEAAKEPEVLAKGKKAEEGEEGAEAPPAAGKAEAKPAPPKEEKKEKKEKK